MAARKSLTHSRAVDKMAAISSPVFVGNRKHVMRDNERTQRIRLEVLSRFPARELLLVAAVACFAGCSSSSSTSSVSSFLPSLPSLPWSGSKSESNTSAEALYREGNQLLANKKYSQAIERYQKLRSDFPFAPEVVGAEMKLGEAYYLNKQYTEAVETLKEFEAMHPNNENIPYALYIAGMSHFDQFSSADRDQKNTEIAKGYFERVVTTTRNRNKPGKRTRSSRSASIISPSTSTT